VSFHSLMFLVHSSHTTSMEKRPQHKRSKGICLVTAGKRTTPARLAVLNRARKSSRAGALWSDGSHGEGVRAFIGPYTPNPLEAQLHGHVQSCNFSKCIQDKSRYNSESLRRDGKVTVPRHARQRALHDHQSASFLLSHRHAPPQGHRQVQPPSHRSLA
jgi:hypothetical protein